jgi:hypothetical protein
MANVLFFGFSTIWIGYKPFLSNMNVSRDRNGLWQG